MYLKRPPKTEQFSVDEFFERISQRSYVGKPVAIQRTWAVLSVVEQ